MFFGPVALGLSTRLRNLSWLTAASMGAVNAVTDHPVAVKRLISLRTHGWLELASAPAAIALPIKAGAVDDPKDRAFFLAVLAATLTTYALTDWNAPPDS